MNRRTGSPSIELEVTVSLTEAEMSELWRRAAQFGIDRSELIRRYVRAGLAVRPAYGTVVDAVTGEHLAPATEPHIAIWLKSHNSVSTPGIFALDAHGQPVALALSRHTDRRVTILEPPDDLDTTSPGSPQNLRILDTMRRASAADRARWMSEAREP